MVLFAAIKADRDGTCCLENPWHSSGGGAIVIQQGTVNGEKVHRDGPEISFSARAGEEYLICPDSESRPIDVVRPSYEPRRNNPRHGYGRLIGIDKEY